MSVNTKRIKCQRCDGHGQVAAGPNYPDECPDCGGSGCVTQYPSGAIAQYVGGPFLAGPNRAMLAARTTGEKE